MKEIQLSQGFVALVDDADFERVSAFKWKALRQPTKIYAYRSVTVDGRARIEYLQVLDVAGAAPSS